MAKIYFLVSIMFVVVTANLTVPVEDTTLENLLELVENIELKEKDTTEERANRQRRVTCDLLSFRGIIGSSACAANCLTMGKAGGYCKSGICVCRKDSFAALWKKRFG
ncbi:defensin-1-like [Vespa velutina]|uniref:defensin-1-like n=1 Tax=Vespa velutina TaxID=202808 RepID=UPI001FB27732|nr:defensin-1-like [Vespa velutina]